MGIVTLELVEVQVTWPVIPAWYRAFILAGAWRIFQNGVEITTHAIPKRQFTVIPEPSIAQGFWKHLSKPSRRGIFQTRVSILYTVLNSSTTRNLLKIDETSFQSSADQDNIYHPNFWIPYENYNKNNATS